MTPLVPFQDYIPCACAWQKAHIKAWKERPDPSYIELVPDGWKYKFCAETCQPLSPWFHYHSPEKQAKHGLWTEKDTSAAYCHPGAMKAAEMLRTDRVQQFVQPLMQHMVMTEYKHPYWLVFPLAPRPIREPFAASPSSQIGLEQAIKFADNRCLVEWASAIRYTGPTDL